MRRGNMGDWFHAYSQFATSTGSRPIGYSNFTRSHEMARKPIAAKDVLEPQTIGLGQLLTLHRTSIPPFQRHYAWSEDEVSMFVSDIYDAMRSGDAEYFLGTLVVCPDEKDPDDLLAVDGQQRLATASIIFAVIRDLWTKFGKAATASKIDSRFLRIQVTGEEETEPKLRLNTSDHNYFASYVLQPGATLSLPAKPNAIRISSNRKLYAALKCVTEWFSGNLPKSQSAKEKFLRDWEVFLEKRAKVVKLDVSNKSAAYSLFETLNWRGVELAVADLIKNMLFAKSLNQERQVATLWDGMAARIEGMQESDGVAQYVRDFWSSREGLVRKKQLFKLADDSIKKPADCVKVAQSLSDEADLYADIVFPDAKRWKDLDNGTKRIKRVLECFSILRISQVRPLLLAVLRKIKEADRAAALEMIGSCAVRILVGGARGGTVEKGYGELAKDVNGSSVSTLAQLRERLQKLAPTDASFEEEFRLLQVTSAPKAKYYLFSLESHANPKDVVGDGPLADGISLEHVLPQSLRVTGWPAFDAMTQQERKDYVFNIGNLCLIEGPLNDKVGSKPFKDKKPDIAKSRYKLTSVVSKSPDWTATDIENRARDLARQAVRTWSL